MAFRTLVLMHTEANTGFAIAPLERTFFRVAKELAGDDSSGVHFVYPSLRHGNPRNLPPDVSSFECDISQGAFESHRLAQYAKANDIALVLAFDLQPTLPLYRLLRRAGVRCILSYWGAEISPHNPLWKRLVKRGLLSLSRSRVNGLIFESEAMADLARYGRGVPNRMIDVVPLGIDLTKFVATRTDYVYSQFDIPLHHKIVVYAGHMEERKGVRFLIEAAVNLLDVEGRDDLTFLLFGDRPGEKERFSDLFSTPGISKNIKFAGYRNDLHLCFPGCTVGVIPSSGWDSFPRTSIEFAASGLPLVVSRLGGLPESIVDGRTGLLAPPGNAAALAKQIAVLLDNGELAREMGQEGRRRCEECFTLDVQFERLKRVLLRRAFEARLSPF